MNRKTSTVGHTAATHAGAIDQNMWASTLNNIDRVDRDAHISKDKTRNTFMTTDFSITEINKEELRYLIQVRKKLDADVAQEAEMKSMSQNRGG